MIKGIQLHRLLTGLLAALFIGSPALVLIDQPAHAQQAAAPAATAAAGRGLTITMKDMGDASGFTLKTVKTERHYHFTKPRGWKILPSSRIHVVFQHSPALLPERSGLNVLLNNRILKTIRLEPGNVTPTALDIAIPANLLKDHNQLSFEVDQHYTYDCEDPFSAELWTTILPDTFMRLDYAPQPIKPDLAKLPYPLVDELNTYMPTRIGYTVPGTLSDPSLEALSTVLVSMGQSVGWREMRPFLVADGDLNAGESLVLVGTPAENASINAMAGSMDLPLSGGKFAGPDGQVLPDSYGVIQLLANPYMPSKAVLIVSGNSPEGVRNAAKALAQNPANRLLVGRSAVIKEFKPGPDHPFRAWDGFIQQSGDTFHKLGLETQSGRGITSLPLFYKIKMMPDVFLPGQRKVKVHTFYSYASQMMPDQSKLEVRFNGKAIKSVPLNNPRGETNAEMVFEINTEDFFVFNDLEYQFHLFPEKYDKCRFTTDVHIWGTVHNTSYVELPGEIKTAIPDVGLINDAGFPFTAYQDLTQVGVVLPKSATDGDKNALIQVLSRLGRESASKRGVNIRAVHADNVPGDLKNSSHLIAFGTAERNPLIKDLNSKTRLLLAGRYAELKTPEGKQAEISHDPSQGIIEELISPWNDKRVVLLVTGENETAMARNAELFMNDQWFGGIEQGNLVVVNDNGPKSLIVLTRGEAKFLKINDLQEGNALPLWAWIALGFLAVLGLFSVLRFLFGR